MISYKGLNKDLTCRGLQYELNKKIAINEFPIICGERGFHSCLNPIDIFNHYSPSDSVFYESSIDGKMDFSSVDSKVSSQKIKITKEINIKDIVDISIKFISDKLDWNKKENHTTGYRSASSATGNSSASSATGNWSASSATGNRSASSATGDSSASSATGDSSASSATGDSSASSATGDRSASSATGDRSASSATGYRSASSATGNSSASSATGDSSASSATGNWSASSATGDRSASSATGNRSASSATGYRSASIVNGYNSNSSILNKDNIISKNAVAIGIGVENKVMAQLWCWIVCAEWDEKKENILNIKSAIVDDETIKPNVWYTVKNNEFVEVILEK